MKPFKQFFKDVEDIDYDPEQLNDGIKVEHEHTTNSDVAEIIAKHHLSEDPDYYKKLKTLGL
jgi:hypothetical protein